jgi:hypothetical protein
VVREGVVTEASGRAARVAPWVAGVVLALPILVLRAPPMTDLPLHEGMVAILRHLHDPAWFPPDLYVTNLGRFNQLFELTALALSVLLGTTLACKAVVAATVVATLVLGARLAVYRGATAWAALALAPLALGWTFYWGFVGNTLGLALLLGALPSLDRLAERASWRSAAIATLWLLALAFAHATSMLCGCGALLVLSIVRGVGRQTPRQLAPIVILAVLTVLEQRVEERHLTPLTRFFATKTLWTPLPSRFLELARQLFGPVGRVPEWSLAALLGALIVAGALASRREAASPTDVPSRWRAWCVRQRFALVAAGLFVAYLAAPYSLNFGAFLHVRFLAPAVAIALVAAAPAPGATPRLFAFATAVVPVAALLVAAPQLAEAQSQNAAIDALLPRVEMGSAVHVMHLGPFREHAAFDVASAGNRVLAERGGRLLFSFAEYPIAPAQVTPRYRWDATLGRVYWDARTFVPEWDFQRLRYLLLHVPDPDLAALVVGAMAPDARLAGAEGEWLLFESRHPVVPLATADAPLPQPSPERLDERVRRLQQP